MFALKKCMLKKSRNIVEVLFHLDGVGMRAIWAYELNYKKAREWQI